MYTMNIVGARNGGKVIRKFQEVLIVCSDCFLTVLRYIIDSSKISIASTQTLAASIDLPINTINTYIVQDSVHISIG